MHFKIEKLLLDTFLLLDYPKLGIEDYYALWIEVKRSTQSDWGILKQIVLKNEGLGPTSKVHKFFTYISFFPAVH